MIAEAFVFNTQNIFLPCRRVVKLEWLWCGRFGTLNSVPSPLPFYHCKQTFM